MEEGGLLVNDRFMLAEGFDFGENRPGKRKPWAGTTRGVTDSRTFSGERGTYQRGRGSQGTARLGKRNLPCRGVGGLWGVSKRGIGRKMSTNEKPAIPSKLRRGGVTRKRHREKLM